MLNNKTPIILLFCFLGLALGLNPTLQKNYFFVSPDNRLSYELFQTRNGVVAHAIDRENSTASFISNYILIDLPSKDAKPILSDVVSACETAPATFQHLHYHAQTNSLVYFCVKNTSLLIIDQSTYLIESEIPLNSNSSLPLARLSTEGMSVVVLSLDTLFTQSPQSSVLYKIDMQTRKLSTQLLLNSSLTAGEAVAVYAASSKSHNYVATNRIENNTFYTVVYSISVIGNAYQLTPLATFSSPLTTKTITKLFCLGNFVVVSDDSHIYFLNSQGDYVKTAKAAFKPLTNDVIPEIYQVGFTSQYDNANIYIHSVGGTIDKYSIVAGTIQVKQVEGSYSNVQIAYGNATSQDLAFTIDGSHQNFKVFDIQASKTIYTALAGYFDFMMTNATYVVVQELDFPYFTVNIFDLKTDALIAQVPVNTHGYYYNKEQQMITLVNSTDSTICRVLHIDLVSGKTWTTLSFHFPDPVCGSFVDSARMTENGNPELVLPSFGYYQIISETYGTLKFETLDFEKTYYYDRINVNFDDLSVYYYHEYDSNLQMNASFCTFNPQSQGFQLQDTNIIAPAPINATYFFVVNSTMMATLSNKTFRLFDKLKSPVFQQFPNNFNLVTSFHDADENHYVLLAFTKVDIIRGSHPELFTTSGANPPLPGKRVNTVFARATGTKSYVLHDYLSQAVGLIRFYDAGSEASKTCISI